MNRKPDLRAATRVTISLRGTLKFGNASFPCLVLDMSDGGFLILPTVTLEEGQVVDFRCELYPGRFLDCKIEVRHADDSGVGTRITEIDEEAARLCQLYLQEHYSGKLDRAV